MRTNKNSMSNIDWKKKKPKIKTRSKSKVLHKYPMLCIMKENAFSKEIINSIDVISKTEW